MKNYLLLFALICIGSATYAQDAKPDSVPPKTFWTDTKAEFQFGYSNYEGNTNKSDLFYGVKLGKKWKMNNLSITASGTYGEVEGERNQENYNIGVFDEIKINKNIGGYVKYGFLKDVIAGYDAVHKIGAGALFTIVDKKELSFKTRLGYEYREENRVGENPLVSMNTGKAGFRLGFTLMKNISVKSEVNYQYDFEDSNNYFADGSVKGVFNVNKNIDIEVFYALVYRNAPPLREDGSEFEQLDRTFRTLLKIKF